ncbi:MAG: phosphonoacetaldehyde hydrolase [Polyangia bacterium]
MSPTERARGPLRAVIFDWAGTLVDFGSLAPVRALQALFAAHGVPITPAQARGPMGLHKREHIRRLAELPEVAAAWQARHGHTFSEADLDALYRAFVPLQQQALCERARPLPGVPELLAELRRRGLRLGGTTGYTAEMAATLLPLAAAHGVVLDAVVTASEVPEGRPAPWMALRCAEQLRAWPMSALVKIGDTPADIDEGRAAGMWTVGLCGCGNELGLDEPELNALPERERTERLGAARARLRAAGAHAVADGPADVPAVLDVLSLRIGRGDRP